MIILPRDSVPGRTGNIPPFPRPGRDALKAAWGMGMKPYLYVLMVSYDYNDHAFLKDAHSISAVGQSFRNPPSGHWSVKL